MPTFFVKTITLLGLGFVLGLKHALEADHIVAVSTIVSHTKSLKKSSIIGALWGAGHTTTLFLSGFIILTLKLVIPAKIALSFEFMVGLVLIYMGLDLLLKMRAEKIHLHAHTHDDQTHSHMHGHAQEKNAHHHHHRSFIVGMIHGLAGSAALMLLVLTTVTSTTEGLLFILIFGFGSMLGMLLTGFVIGLPFALTAQFEKVNMIVKAIAGIMSIIIGIGILYEIAIVKHLLY